jgi:ATP-dependent DNA ligase
VIITGVGKEGEGKYAGLVGSLSFSVYDNGALVECGQASGFTDKLRKQFTKLLQQGKLIGDVMEIRGQEPTSTIPGKGRVRHPRYRAMRPDYNANECTWEKCMADLTVRPKKRA